jgi:hypothetical protein
MATTTEVGVKITVDGSEATKSVGSIKSQLKEATAELIAMREKFGDTSDEAVAAAKKVANLKDSIGDAKAMADAFNPDAKFKAFGSALQGVAGGFSAVQGAMGLMGGESKEVEAMLLKVNSAMALSQGVDALLEAKDGFKNLKTVAVDAFKGIKTAIGSTGIGLLVVALGAIYAYWDDIKAAVGGVNKEQKKLNQASADNLKIQQQKLDAIGSQDNILKLQGKSERDILKLKIAQTDETITAGEANLQNLKATRVEQVKIAERNKELLKGLLNFLSVPITAILFAVDKIRSKMGQTSNLLEDYKEGLANLVFNPEKVAEEGDMAIAEAEKSIVSLKNQRAGYQLQIQAIDKEANNKRIQDADDKNKKELEKNEQYNTELKRLQEKNLIDAIKNENDKAEAILNLQLTNDVKRINASNYSEQQKNALLIETQKQYQLDIDTLNAKRDADAQKALDDAQIKEQERTAKNNETRKAEYDKKIEAEKQQTAREKEESDKRIAIAQAERDAKISAFESIGNSLNILSDLVGKNTEAGKGFAIASLIIEQATAIAKIITNTQVANAKSIALSPLTGGQPFVAINTISAGLSIASSIASVVKGIRAIRGANAKSGGGGASGGGAPSLGGGTVAPPLPPQLETQSINAGQINQLASATARAYVVESDVSGNQERINRLNRASRIN